MKRSLFLFILSLQIWICNAENYYSKTIGISNGLSNSSVTDVVYDNNGTLWIGTRFGLNEYRNGKLRTFIDNGSGKVTGNFVNLLYCDSYDNLWVSTDKGIFRYDLSSDSFAQYDENPAFCATETPEGLFFGCHNGIGSYSFLSGTFSSGKSESYMDYVALDSYDGALMEVERKEGIILEYQDSSVTISIPELEGNLIMAAARAENTLFLAVMNLGLIQYDLSSRSVQRIFRSGQEGMPAELILTLLIDRNRLLIGTDGAGLFILDIESGMVHTVDDLHYFPSGGQLPISITCLYQDPSQNLWIGSVRGGLVGLKPSPIKLISVSQDIFSEKNAIISLLSSEDGYLYIGTDGNGIRRCDPKTAEIEAYPDQDGLKVTAIEDYDKDRLIVFLYNRGYFLMNRQTGKLSPFIIVDNRTNASECLNSNAPKIYNIGDSRLLLLAVNTYLYDKESGKFELFTDETLENGKELIVLGKTDDNSYYAYSPYGLFRISLASKTVSLLYQAGAETGEIGTAVLHNGIIHFGTNYGLFAFDINSAGVTKIPSELFNRVSRLHYSTGGNLWVAADNTLFLYRGGVFEVVGENRGVPANEFLACESTDEGSVYFGGTAGLVEIGSNYSYEIKENKHILLHSISVTGNRISNPEGILKLRHNYSSLVLTVNLAGADPFEKVLYRYTVDGNNGFTSKTFEDNLEIPGLKQGNYRVEASYLMANGQWSIPENILEMKVSPPWYKSMIMLLIYVIAVLTALSFLVEVISRKRIAKIEAEMRSKDIAFTESLLDIINNNLGDPNLNVTEIARNMAMSRASLYYKVNSSFGKGVAELIEERRMSVAEELLKTTHMSILDISEKVGYSTPRYFSTRFKQLHEGCTPLKYRNKFS